MNLLILLCLGVLMHALRSFEIAGAGAAGTSLAVGYLLLTAYFVGDVFRALRLPRLTGYIATGLIVGPDVMGLLPAGAVVDLKLVNGIAVVLIALTAGTELELRSIRPLAGAIGWITLLAVVGSALLLALAVFLASPLLPFMDGMDTQKRLAVAAVLGVVMAAQSPAVVVALADETRADGPLARTVLGVVVLADLAVILLFALSSTVANAVLGGAVDLARTLQLLGWELFGSLVAGAVLGVLVALYLRKVRHGASLFLLTVAFVTAEVGLRLHLDPLLVALATGVLVRNWTKAGDALHHAIAGSALPVYVLFFAVAGANLHLDVLRQVGAAALLFVGVRAAGMLAGARLGARVARAPEVVVRYAGFGLLPQAGLALALALLFARAFPQFGDGAGALTLGVVAVNEIAAPIVYRIALLRSGEAGRRGAEDDAEPAPAAEGA